MLVSGPRWPMAPSVALTTLLTRPHTGPHGPDPDNRGTVQHILALSRSAVTIRHWFEINLDDASMEHGARIEIRELSHHPRRGSESASQLTTVDRPLWRADLFDRLADPPGSFSAAHYHPQFTGNEPSARFSDAALTADPWAWLGDQITSLGAAAGGAGWPLDPADASELAAWLALWWRRRGSSGRPSAGRRRIASSGPGMSGMLSSS